MRSRRLRRESLCEERPPLARVGLRETGIIAAMLAHAGADCVMQLIGPFTG